MTVSPNGDSFTLTWKDGSSAVIDTESDVMTSDNIGWFVSFGEDEKDIFAYLEILRFDPEPQPGKLDLGKYGIDLHAGEDDIWIPAVTACDIFHINGCYGGYENGKLYFFGLSDDFSASKCYINMYFDDMAKDGRPADQKLPL